MKDEIQFCPIHGIVLERLADMKAIQEARRCISNESDIRHLAIDMQELKDEHKDMWNSINSLRRMVYMGAGATGVLAFLGSVVGAFFKR